MKKIFKLAAGVFAATLAVSSFAGCSKKDETVQSTDQKNFTYWAVVDANTQSTGIGSYSDLMLYQELEKRTGVHLDFIHPVQGSTGSEAFVTMLSAGERPDMIEYNWGSYIGGSQQALDDEVIVCLDEYLEEYAPNYNDYMNGEKGKAKNNLYKLQTTTHLGHHYGFNSLNIGDLRIFSGICIRSDLLEKWGMDIPVTIDDWSAVFAKAKSEGIEKPFTGINFDLSFTGSTPTFNTGFNVGKYYYVEDGKVVYAPFQDGYKEYVAQLAEWTKKGYIDTDYITNDGAKVQGNLANGISIAASGNIGGTIGSVVPAARKTNPEFTLTACPFPVAKEGDIPEYLSKSGEASGLAIAISTECANVVDAVEWCDYLYGDEGSTLRNFGLEGVHHTVEEIDGEKHYVYTDKITDYEKDGLTSIGQALYKYFLPANHPGLNQHPDYLNGYYAMDEQKHAVKVWNDGVEACSVHFLPNLEFTEDEASEKTDYLEVLDPELEVAISDIILGKASIDTFDAAVKKAYDGGFKRVLEIYQAAYDRYMSKVE